MKAKITSPFRIREEDGAQRAYELGDIAVDGTAEWAIKHGFGEETDDESGPESGGSDTSNDQATEPQAGQLLPENEKAAPAPNNKAARPAKNKYAE